MAQQNLKSILIQPEKVSESDLENFVQRYSLSADERKEIIEILDSPKVDILNDLPTSQDTLGFTALVRTISNIVLSKSTQTPLTIGINGQWGSGKTSLLKMIEAQVKLLDFPCIWLNAWILESSEAFFDYVYQKIYRQFNLDSDDTENAELRRDLQKWRDFPLGIEFGRIVKNLLEKQDKNTSARLVIFIDDIDRAFPEQIAMILKNLKIILESYHCVFILAMDIDIVAQSLTKFYQSHQFSRIGNIMNIEIDQLTTENFTMSDEININENRQVDTVNKFGHGYLEKLIQIRFQVPTLTKEIVEKYLQQIGIVDEILKIILLAAPEEEILNPRRLKRYINWLSISLQLMTSIPIPVGIKNITALQLMVLRRDHPSIYRELIKGEIKEIRVSEEAFKDYLWKNFCAVNNQLLREFDNFLQQTPLLEVQR